MRHPKLSSGYQIAGLMCDDHDDKIVPIFSDFKALAAKHIEEALGVSCKNRETNFRAFRLFFNTFHNNLSHSSEDGTLENNSDDEVYEDLNTSQLPFPDDADEEPYETDQARRKRIRIELGQADTDVEEDSDSEDDGNNILLGI